MTTSESTPTFGSFSSPGTEATGERADILEVLRTHRYFLTHTAAGLTDEQARLSPTASELTVGGIIKHVAATTVGWLDFVERGTEAMPAVDFENPDPEVIEKFHAEFRVGPDETLAQVLEEFERVGARTDELVKSVDLDLTHALPPAPWFEPGATRSARRVFLHLVAEIAQHAGHADVIRETIDGQKTMG